MTDAPARATSPLTRAVLDTNVILSAILFGGVPLAVLNAWRLDGAYQLVMTPEILAEIVAKLREKFGLPRHLVDEWRHLFSDPLAVLRVVPARRIRVCRDPGDDKFIEAAIAADAGFIVTGDADLLSMGRHEGVRILSPRGFASLLDVTAPGRSRPERTLPGGSQPMQ